MIFFPVMSARSPRMVPGAEASGLVAPIIFRLHNAWTNTEKHNTQTLATRAHRSRPNSESDSDGNVPLPDYIFPLENHSHNRSATEKLAQSWKEGALCKIVIMLLCVLKRRGDELECDQFETALFETRDDLTDEATLHGIRLQHDVATLILIGHNDRGAGGDGGGGGGRDGRSARLEQAAAGLDGNARDDGGHYGVAGSGDQIGRGMPGERGGDEGGIWRMCTLV